MSKKVTSPEDCPHALLASIGLQLQQLSDVLCHYCCDKLNRPNIRQDNWRAQSMDTELIITHGDNQAALTFSSPNATLTLVTTDILLPLTTENIAHIEGSIQELATLVTAIIFALIGHEIDNKDFFLPLTPKSP